MCVIVLSTTMTWWLDPHNNLLINEVGQRRKFQSMAISFESIIVGVRVHHRKLIFVSLLMVVQQEAHSLRARRCEYQAGLSSTTNHISLILMNTHHAQNVGKVLTSMGRRNAKMSMCADLVGQKETLAAFHFKSPWYLHERSQVPGELSKVFERVPDLCCWRASVPAPWQYLLRLVVHQERICITLFLALSPHGARESRAR